MPKFNATATWSANIAVVAGDMIQSQGSSTIRVRAAAQAADAAHLELTDQMVYRFETANSIQIRTDAKQTGTMSLIRGL